MRISQENENSKGTSDRQPQKKPGQKKINYRLGLSFPKSLRILSRKYFQRLITEGIRLPCKVLFLQYSKSKPPTRLGITVSKKYGKAHDRNRFKRLVREVFRENYHEIPPGIQLNVLPRLPRTELKKEQVLLDFKLFIALLSNQIPNKE